MIAGFLAPLLVVVNSAGELAAVTDTQGAFTTTAITTAVTDSRGELVTESDVVISAPRVRREIVEARVDAETARQVPGTQGDVVQVVFNLPGVGRPAVGSGDLVVWGASPGDTRAYLDDVPVPRLFHAGGFRATVGSDLIDSVDVVPGAYAADYGRALGGLVRASTAPVDEVDGVRGHAGVDPLDASASVRADLRDGLAYGASGRYGWLDRTLGPLLDDEAEAFIQIPRYWDYQQKLVWVPSKGGEHVEILSFGSGDTLRTSSAGEDPSSARFRELRTSFHRLALRWERDVAGGASVTVVPWIGTDVSVRHERFGAIPAGSRHTSLRGGLRASRRWRATSWAVIRAGADVEGADAIVRRTGSLTLPAREGDGSVFGLAPSDRVSVDEWSARMFDAALYVTARAEAFGGRLTFEPGVRAGALVLQGDRVVPTRAGEPPVGLSRFHELVEPRMGVMAELTDRIALFGAGGVHHQPPDPADLSPVFGNPALGPSRAVHALTGVQYRLGAIGYVRTAAFHTRSNGLGTRTPLEGPPVARLLLPDGEGRTSGAQLDVRGQWSRAFGWISYTLLRSERRDREGARWRLFDQDQTHVLSATAGGRPLRSMEIAARARYATGNPRTPVVGSVYNAGTGAYDPVFGEHNGERLPAFVQLDVRVAWNREWKNGRVIAYLDVQNVTNRGNAEEVVYNHDFSRRAFLRGIPFLPAPGIRAEF